MLSPFDEVPVFTLLDQDSVLLCSADLVGSWYLIYWYPRADTPGCTAQAEGLAAQIDAFGEFGCVVLGASFDAPETNRAFRQKYLLPFRLLSDDGTVAEAFGAGSPGSGSAMRVAHLVGPDGRVARTYVVDDPSFFAEQVLDDLEDLTGS